MRSCLIVLGLFVLAVGLRSARQAMWRKLGALVFLAAPLLSLDPVRSWAALPRAWRLWPLLAVAAVSWLWQLHRFGFL